MKKVTGSPATPYDWWLPTTIGPAGYGCGCCFSKLLKPSDVSWLLAPTKAIPGCLLAPFASTSSSWTQVVHQDAQKFSTTGLPCSSHTSTCPPPCGSIASRGAVLPSTEGLARAACCRPHASDSTSTVARTIAPAAKTPDLRLTRLSLAVD